MKFLSLLLSLLLGAVVLAFFLRPWEMVMSPAPEAAKAPPAATAPPGAAANGATAAVEAKPSGGTAAEPKPAEAKTHLLANEQAEASRNAALEKDHAVAAAPPKLKRYFKVTVRDAGTLEAGAPPDKAVVIRLDGIKAREAEASCTKADGSDWPCGAEGRAALTLLIRSRAVTCALPPGGESREFTARCSVTNQDLSTWLVRQGWAMPQTGTEAALAEALQAAKTEHLGLWSTE
jgi:endonuclease YncB( thermonuclease family)